MFQFMRGIALVAAMLLSCGAALRPTVRLALRLCLSEFATKHDSKQFGVIGVWKTVKRVPRIVFADRTNFRRNAQFGVEVAHHIEGLAAHSVC